MAETRPVAPAIADPAPLGLGAFALTTFVLSVHNAGWAPDFVWIGLAIFYGGLAQFLAGMWEFRNNNTFGAVAFSTYGGFWLALGSFVLLLVFKPALLAAGNVDNGLGWFLLAFAIFNTYMMLWATRVNVAVFLVFLTLELTEIILFIGFFQGSKSIIQVGGVVGVVTAAVAWYASAALVIRSLGSPVLPVGTPLWSGPAAAAAPGRVGGTDVGG
jgi:succinate-acetate transporter protein